MGWAGKTPGSIIYFFWFLSHCTVSSKLQLPAEALGKSLLLFWHEPHVFTSKAGTPVCFWGWLREESNSHSEELILYYALGCPSLHSPMWVIPNKMHTFVTFQLTVSWFCVFTLLCTEVASTNRYAENYIWRPMELSLLLVCWDCVTDLEEHLTLWMETAISAGSPAECRESCCDWAWQDCLLLRVVIQSHATYRRGLICFRRQVSICCIYVYIWDTCISVSSAVLIDKNLVSSWTEQSFKNIQSFCNMQGSHSREKTRRPISGKIKLAWRHCFIKLTLCEGQQKDYRKTLLH